MPSVNAVPGDLYLGIRILENEDFIRRGNDLYTPMDIDMVTAITGGKIKVPTLDYKNNQLTEKELSIPPGTQYGTEFRIKNHGVPYLRGKAKGDQYVVVRIEIPKDINEEQKKLLLKFRELSKKGK